MEPLKNPVTETANELTRDLDMSTPLEMVRLFRQSDEQMFTGWRGYPALLDDETVAVCAQLARHAARVIEAGERGAILISGAGTSGRLAQLISRQFNRLLRNAHRPALFRPLVAGGPLALVKAQEGAEDDPHAAVSDLKENLPDKPKAVLYVGVTCGMSAPYCAGQLDYLRDKDFATSVLLGFNPRETARNVAVEGWEKTFAQVVDECSESNRFVLLNPVYGPESVMGSTRMKGGSATKILLETIFYIALELLSVVPPEEGVKPLAKADDAALERRVADLLGRYRQTMHAVYNQTALVAEIVRMAGAAFRSGGKISYLGRESAGITGLIDASECPPTFGATFEDIRGFLNGGWQQLLDDDRDFSASGPEFQVDLNNFESSKLPDLSKGDLVLGVAIGEVGPVTRMLLESSRKTRATAAVVLVSAVAPKKGDLPVDDENALVFTVPSLGFAPGLMNLAEFALKLVLNALSTGAHVMIGKVYENRMIDLRISNNKLYFRAIRIIRLLAKCTEDQARGALHRAVFRTNALTADMLAAPPSAIIKAATESSRVVPTALLMAIGDMTVEQAVELLQADPVPRRVIQNQLEKQQG